jgi:hypothetical protein
MSVMSHGRETDCKDLARAAGVTPGALPGRHWLQQNFPGGNFILESLSRILLIL